MSDETSTPRAGAFDPARHMTRVGGGDYLEVKWRLVWFRSEYPYGVIDTEMVQASDTHAIFKATVTAIHETGEVRGSATGWGSEERGDFGDFLEKAETKAIGRALAALGFGTQFGADHEFGADRNRVVDAPLREERRQRAQAGRDSRAAMSDAQMKKIRELATELSISDAQLNAGAEKEYGAPVDALTRGDASKLIDRLLARKRESGGGQ